MVQGKEVGKLAKFSQSGVHPTQMKHLKKTLSAVDDRIKLPESLCAGALLCKLEGVQPNIPTGKKVRELVLPKRRRFRTLIGYAAAFALVVGLLYNLGLNRPDLLASGEIELGGPVAELAPIAPGGGISPAVEGRAVMPAHGEIGVRLGELGEYLLYYLPAEAGGPSHSGIPIVLMLLDADGQAVISQVDLPYTTNIESFFTDGYVITFFNGSGQLLPTYTVDFTDPQNPFIVTPLE